MGRKKKRQAKCTKGHVSRSEKKYCLAPTPIPLPPTPTLPLLPFLNPFLFLFYFRTYQGVSEEGMGPCHIFARLLSSQKKGRKNVVGVLDQLQNSPGQFPFLPPDGVSISFSPSLSRFFFHFSLSSFVTLTLSMPSFFSSILFPFRPRIYSCVYLHLSVCISLSVC